MNPSIAESNPRLAADAPTAGLEPTALASRRGIAILLLLSLVQFMDVLDEAPPRTSSSTGLVARAGLRCRASALARSGPWL